MAAGGGGDIVRGCRLLVVFALTATRLYGLIGAAHIIRERIGLTDQPGQFTPAGRPHPSPAHANRRGDYGVIRRKRSALVSISHRDDDPLRESRQPVLQTNWPLQMPSQVPCEWRSP